MHSGKKTKLKINSHKQLLFSSLISMGFICPLNVISEPLNKPRFNKLHTYSEKSFITKAVEKTGSSVVTINTQRYVKKRGSQRNPQLFLDPYFDRFFGLDLPYDINQG